ncbi:MAG: oxygenase MpaB family protein [Thermomicrobium sp.]
MQPTTPPLVQIVNAERIVVLGWGRAILAQLAHPLIAAGVADHSTFARDTWAAFRRFQATVRAMRALTFGPPEAAREAARRIARKHDQVQGILREPLARFPAGTRYSAHDPELLTWVHVTTIEATLVAYERFVAPLTPAQRDQYCQEATAMQYWLGVPPGTFPNSWQALQETITQARQDGIVTVTPLARALAERVLDPPRPWWLTPAAVSWRWFTVGLLPDWLRQAYGLPWSARNEQQFDHFCAFLRRLWCHLPNLIRQWPEARARLPLPTPPAYRSESTASERVSL